jgi:hypothetical protein
MKRIIIIGLAVMAGSVSARDQRQVRQVQAQQIQQIEEIQQQIPIQNLQMNQFRNAQNIRGIPNSRRAAFAGAVHEPYDGVLSAEAIRTAIDDTIQFLVSRQREDGSLGDSHGRDVGGYTSLAALTMLAAGRNPASDDALRKALDFLITTTPDSTYVRGIRANVWEYALRKVPYDEAIRAALKKDYDWLMKALGKKEGWRYQMSSRDWDNSVTQYGVLGVWAAARGGIDAGDAFWEKMSKHFRKVQSTNGGWGYQTSGSTANMATAGLATMFLVFDMYHGKSFYSSDNPRAFSSGAAKECIDSIQRGMNWLGKHGGSNNDGYYLYGIERTGVASGRKYIGGRDWFREGADVVLQRQSINGSVPTSGHGGILGGSAFSALFLVYGGAPVAFNKLEYGDDQDWNLNPRDLANLTKFMWSAYERPLNWHSVGIDAPVSEFEAPILFISGSKTSNFSEKDVAKLKAYVESGGTVLAEPTDHSKAFRAGMEKLVGRMFPQKDYPDCVLKDLPADHGIYTVIRQTWKDRPRVRGVSDGNRTFFFLSEDYLSARWQMNETEDDAFKLAMNLLFYATDLKTLDGKYASILPDTEPAPARHDKATVARVRYTSAPTAPLDWATASSCWQRFAPYLKHIAGCGLEERPAVRLAEDDLKGIHLLHLTGAHAVSFSQHEREALKQYVEDGGVLLVDAYVGSTAFAETAHREIEAMFGTLEHLKDESLLASGRFLGGADLSRVKYKLAARRLLRDRGMSTRNQHLRVVHVNRRPAILFSDLDLTGALAGIDSYQAKGYKPESARKVVGNLLAYVTAD